MDYKIYLYRNPYRSILPDGVILQILQTAAVEVAEELDKLIKSGQAGDVDSFGVVMFNPVRNREAREATDRLLAAATFGPKGWDLLPNAFAKADAHDRTNLPNGVLVAQASFCLDNDDFAWGHSAAYTVDASHPSFPEEMATYEVAIAGGSGLSAQQDHDMAHLYLVKVMDQIKVRRYQFIDERRRAGSHGWYNTMNQPGARYLAIHEMEPIATA